MNDRDELRTTLAHELHAAGGSFTNTDAELAAQLEQARGLAVQLENENTRLTNENTNLRRELKAEREWRRGSEILLEEADRQHKQELAEAEHDAARIAADRNQLCRDKAALRAELDAVREGASR